MPSLIIFLAAAVTAIAGPWVDAPAIMSTLSGCIAIVVAWISITSLRRSLHEAQDTKQPDPSEIEPTQSPDSSMLQSRLQVESMRIQALESELRETKKKHDELLHERIELLRRSAPIEPIHSRTGVLNQLQGGREAAQSIRQRDLWIQAQQASLGEFKSGLNQVTTSLQQSLALLSSISLASLNEGANESKSGIQLKALLGRCAAAFQKETNENQTSLAMMELKATDSIDGICTGFLSLKNRLEEIADHARVAAMNARLLKDRPTEADALESLDKDIENISSGLKDLVKISGPFVPDLERAHQQIEHNRKALTGRADNLMEMQNVLEHRMERITAELYEGQHGLEKIMRSDVESKERRRIDLDRIEVSVENTTEALTNACTIAHSLDLTIERMVEVSKIATGRSDAIKMPQETSAND